MYALLILTVLLRFCFFQPEDGIRYYKVTGVQTCALPIYRPGHRRGRARGTERTRAPRAGGIVRREARPRRPRAISRRACPGCSGGRPPRPRLRDLRNRSEERRVGDAGRDMASANRLAEGV